MADLKGQGVYLAVYNIINPAIKVSAVEEDGSLSLICWYRWYWDYNITIPNQMVWPSVSLPAGYNKIVVAITGDYIEGSNGFMFQGSLNGGGTTTTGKG